MKSVYANCFPAYTYFLYKDFFAYKHSTQGVLFIQMLKLDHLFYEKRHRSLYKNLIYSYLYIGRTYRRLPDFQDGISKTNVYRHTNNHFPTSYYTDRVLPIFKNK